MLFVCARVCGIIIARGCRGRSSHQQPRVSSRPIGRRLRRVFVSDDDDGRVGRDSTRLKRHNLLGGAVIGPDLRRERRSCRESPRPLITFFSFSQTGAR